MKIVFLDADTLGACDLSAFRALGQCEVYGFTTKDEVLERCKGAEIVIANKVLLDSTILSQLTHLKLICITATGMNNVDLDYAAKHNIIVKNVANYSTNAVAQHTFSIVLQLLSRLNYYDSYCKSGKWCDSAIFTHINGGLKELVGLKWGIIGFGNIGQRVAHIATAFGAEVCYHSTSGKNNQAKFNQVGLESLLKHSDIITIHAPLNPSTKNLINASNLGLLKDGALLVNVGRGGIVNEADMAKALQDRDIYFGADVLESEPMSANHPLLDSTIAHKIVLTPHIAWAYDKARVLLIERTLDNVCDYINAKRRQSGD